MNISSGMMKTHVDSDPDWVMMKTCLQQLAGYVPVTTGSFRHHSHLWFSLMWHTVTFSDTLFRLSLYRSCLKQLYLTLWCSFIFQGDNWPSAQMGWHEKTCTLIEEVYLDNRHVKVSVYFTLWKVIKVLFIEPTSYSAVPLFNSIVLLCCHSD